MTYDDINQQKMNKFKNLWKSIYVSSAFFLLFMAFFVMQNITTQVMINNGLGSTGFTLLAVQALIGAIGSLFSYELLRRLGITKCLFIGGISHFIFIVAHAMPSWSNSLDYDNSSGFIRVVSGPKFVNCCLFLAVIINGIGIPTLWVAIGEYFSICGTEETIAFYFRMFWIIYQSSQMFGALLSFFILHFDLSMTQFYLIWSAVALVACIALYFNRKPYILDNSRVLYLNGLNQEADYYTNASQSIIYNQQRLGASSFRNINKDGSVTPTKKSKSFHSKNMPDQLKKSGKYNDREMLIDKHMQKSKMR